MKPFRFFLVVSTLALAFLFTLAFSAANAKHKAADTDTPIDSRILIKSVDAAAGTVEIEYMRDKTAHSYKIDDGTSIKVNDARGKIADIKAGMVVKDFVERDPKTLDSISVTSSGSAP